MAIFVSKEEILTGVREIPAATGAAPPMPGSSPLSLLGNSGSPLGGGNGLDQLERILTQINGIVTQVNSIRNNPTTKALIGGASATAQAGAPAQFIESAKPAIQTAPAQVQIQQAEVKPMKTELNEEGVRAFLDAVINELDAMPEDIKGLKIGDAILGYKMFSQKKEQFQNNAIVKFKEWLPKIIRVE